MVYVDELSRVHDDAKVEANLSKRLDVFATFSTVDRVRVMQQSY